MSEAIKISHMAALSALSLTKYTRLSTPRLGENKTVKDPFTSRSKFNATCVNSHFKLVSKSNSGWRIKASEWPSVSNNPEKLSVGLSQGLESSLALAELFDLNGNTVHLTDLWKDRKAVVGFARHFGCVLCRKRADVLASQKSQMDAAGVALVLIGPGNIEQAKAFVDQTKFPGEIYADPNHTSFNALKFVSGVFTTFTPLAATKIIESYVEGYRQDWRLSFQKDTVNRGGWQQGGILVAGPGRDNILYLHKISCASYATFWSWCGGSLDCLFGEICCGLNCHPLAKNGSNASEGSRFKWKQRSVTIFEVLLHCFKVVLISLSSCLGYDPVLLKLQKFEFPTSPI